MSDGQKDTDDRNDDHEPGRTEQPDRRVRCLLCGGTGRVMLDDDGSETTAECPGCRGTGRMRLSGGRRLQRLRTLPGLRLAKSWTRFDRGRRPTGSRWPRPPAVERRHGEPDLPPLPHAAGKEVPHRVAEEPTPPSLETEPVKKKAPELEPELEEPEHVVHVSFEIPPQSRIAHLADDSGLHTVRHPWLSPYAVATGDAVAGPELDVPIDGQAPIAQEINYDITGHKGLTVENPDLDIVGTQFTVKPEPEEQR